MSSSSPSSSESIVLPQPAAAAAAAAVTSSAVAALSTHKGINHLRQYLAHPTVSAFVAGGVAGAVSRTVVSPFERMKIIFQCQGAPSAPAAYEGVGPTLAKMWREEGWRGFMRGNGANCIRIVPYSAVQFSAYTILKSNIIAYHTPSADDTAAAAAAAAASQYQLTALERLAAGCLAGSISVVATYPLDIVRTRLSIQTASITNLRDHYAKAGVKPPGMRSVMAQIYRTEGGCAGLYRGIVPTTMGVAPYVGINFAVYEHVRELFIQDGSKDPSALAKLAAGAISGAVAQTVTYPFDVLRRRFQVLSVGSLGFQYTSVAHALSTIVKTEGVPGLYKGLSANLLKVVPSMAASWLSFEFVKDLLEL